jgi:hypothetical protein
MHVQRLQTAVVSTLVRYFMRLLVSRFAALAVLGSADARSGYKKSFNVGSSRLTLKPLQESNAKSLWTNAGQPTAAYDPRQFQFAMKVNW